MEIAPAKTGLVPAHGRTRVGAQTPANSAVPGWRYGAPPCAALLLNTRQVPSHQQRARGKASAFLTHWLQPHWPTLRVVFFLDAGAAATTGDGRPMYIQVLPPFCLPPTCPRLDRTVCLSSCALQLFFFEFLPTCRSDPRSSDCRERKAGRAHCRRWRRHAVRRSVACHKQTPWFAIRRRWFWLTRQMQCGCCFLGLCDRYTGRA